MPTYVYECPKCKKTIELQQSISKKLPPMCFEEDCDIIMESVISKTGFQLKGSGWARDGYASKKD